MHETFMKHALALAGRGAGKTSPNPMVGAVVVRNGRIVGEGYHSRAGGPHAEILALRRAGARARGATLYVTLEPCCHYGRTPPCTDAILASGVRRVVAGMKDPNPRVQGGGFRILKRAGLALETGILEAECLRLNETFIKFIRTGRPFVISKTALSLDGKIATAGGESQWISGPAARRYVHRLRSRVDAILVGAGTVLKDDPRLTARVQNRRRARQPARVVLDAGEQIALTARVFQRAIRERVIYVTGRTPSRGRLRKLEARGVTVWCGPVRGGRIDLPALMARLGKEGITSVLLEGGGELNAGALHAGIVDKLVWFVAPILLGGKAAPGPLGGPGLRRLRSAWKLRRWSHQRVGTDLLIEGYL